MDEHDELVKEFLIESYENIDSLDEDLMSLEENPTDPGILARIFRAVHTLKGTGGFLDFNNLVSITHAGESLLDALRSGEIVADSDIVNVLLELVDAIREVLAEIESSGKDGDEVYAELIKSLNAIKEGNELTSNSTSQDPMLEMKIPLPAKEPKSEVPGIQIDENAPDVSHEEDVQEYLDETFDYLEETETKIASLDFDKATCDALMDETRAQVGSTNFIGYIKLAKFLASFRKKLLDVNVENAPLDPNTQRILQAYLNVATQALKHVKKTGKETDQDYQSIVDQLIEAQKSEELVSQPADPSPVVQTDAPAETSTPELTRSEEPESTQPETPSSQTPVAKERTSEEPAKSVRKENTIRVNVELLDTLMNLVGELVLARNQILQFTSADANIALTKSSHNLNLITTELQESVMKTRMQTLSTIWKKFPRVVRDLAKTCNKQAKVEMEGADTELDKTIIEAINDPLTHLIRNSVDHGIESPEERVKKGKPPYGTLRLHAFHEGGRVNIEISDDGAGINPEKIKKKALESGVITQAEAARMSDREVLNLIFKAGFSTAKEVSNISGRGVGMDVVKTHIERIGGSIDIQSKVNHGTTLRIKIPLTLAIIPALIIKVRGERYALPQVNLLELVRLEGNQITSDIEFIDATPVYRLRGELLPLVYLSDALGLEQPEIQEKENGSEVINIVVLQAEDQQFGLIVNEVVDTEEVVVKPLSKLIKHIDVLAGATIMGDGKIALILDVVGLARQGGVMANSEQIQSLNQKSMRLDDGPELTILLIAKLGEDRRIGVPLSMISRLEELDAANLEHVSNTDVIQYRNRLMPLIRLDKAMGARSTNSADNELLHVIVCEKNGVMIGLVVDEILDIVNEYITSTEGTGIVQSVAIIQDKATEIVNIQELIDQVDTRLFEMQSSAQSNFGKASL